MGHATHFLSRLERVSPAEVDLAMSLYRDPALVKLMLGEAKPPENAERIAIALRHEPGGPHLVVSRDGGFITCLGAGMAHELPVISRAKVDSVNARAALMFERLKPAEETLKSAEDSIRYFRRLHEAAHQLSREEITPALGLAPIVAFEYLRDVGDQLREIGRAKVHAEQAKKDRTLEHAPRRYWERVWSLGHFTLLGFSDLEMVRDYSRGEYDKIVPAAVCTSVLPTVGASTRGLWACGHLGKTALPVLKRMLGEDGFMSLREAPLGLTTIALGHARLEAEVRKALPPANPATGVLLDLLDHPDAYRARALEQGRSLAVFYTKHLPPESRWHFPEKEAVPEEMAFAFAANALESTNTTEGLVDLVELLPWLARARPEELYLPRDLIEAVDLRWEPSMTEYLLEKGRGKPKEPVVKAAEPGRNDPCSCGSGKKFKKCCAAA